MNTSASPRKAENTATLQDAPNPASLRAGGVAAALLPVVSFLLQYLFSVQAGTYQFLIHHSTVMIVDWIFVPFNYLVVGLIDWRQGARIYIIAGVSVVLNAVTHAYWQYNGLDSGHMISKTQVVLPAGWVHLAFSSLEMILLVAFVFCRKADIPARAATVLATLYFAAGAVCSYMMHRAFIVTDAIVFASGLFFVLAYPLLRHRLQ